MPETQHVIPYNYHGMTVFISPLEDAMRDWLIPIGGVFIFLSLVAAAMLFVAAGVEAFWSSANWLSPMLKYGVASLCWAAVFGYFMFQGRHAD